MILQPKTICFCAQNRGQPNWWYAPTAAATVHDAAERDRCKAQRSNVQDLERPSSTHLAPKSTGNSVFECARATDESEGTAVQANPIVDRQSQSDARHRVQRTQKPTKFEYQPNSTNK